jgi:ubiquinone/menaquinone biosynthesis C-methylase UbiE
MNDPHQDISSSRIFTMEQQIVVLEDIDDEGHVLDIGGGGEGIIGRLRGNRVIAIDPDRRELEEAPDGPVKIVMNATDLKFLDGVFHVVTSFFTLMYIAAELHDNVFKEAYRVLVPGGKFLIWDVEFPRRTDPVKDIITFPLTVKLPDDEISTGYGVRWPEDGRDIYYFIETAKKSGFEVSQRKKTGHLIYLELRKSDSK